MAQISTSSQTDVLTFPTLPPFARDMSTGTTAGHLFSVVKSAADTLSLYRSTDSGGTWGLMGSFTHTGLQEWSGLVIDRNGYGHLAYRVGTGTADTIWYRRVVHGTGAWTSGLQTSSTDANGGSIGSVWQGVDLAVVNNADNTYMIAIAAARTEGSTRYGVMIMGVTINGSGTTITGNNAIFVNNRAWWTSGTAPGRSGVTCEVEHNGDGFTASTPHLWVSWGRTALRMVKLSWQGSSVGWNGPSGFQLIASSIPTQDYCGGRWDGTRWMMPTISPADATIIRVYQRNQGNTTTTSIDTPTHTTGNIRQFAVGYDNATKNPRVYGVGTSTGVLYFADYDRSLGTWGSWATVVATAVLGPGEWGVRRGGSAGNARLDVVTAHSGAPNTIVHTAQTASSVPSTATWDTSAQPYFNGGAADVNAGLTLDWTFSDPDPGQTQGSYALSRQIGAGALQYYTAAGGTWGGVEVQNSSATSAVTLASGWAAGTDANYTFKVKVWDSGGTPAAAYSSALVLIPSVKVNPSITAPTAAQVLGTDQVTVTWTAAEQTAYRLRLSTNPGGVFVYDSGYISSSSLSVTIPYDLANGSGWTVELTTKNNEGLASTAQTRNFTISYLQPPGVWPSFVTDTANGEIHVTSNNLAVVGAQPAISMLDLFRRPVTTPELAVNGTFDTASTTGWTNTGGTLAYSTTQAHQGAGAGFMTPTGVAADTQITTASANYAALQAGATYMAGAWIRPTTANKSIKIQVNFYNSSNTLLGSVTNTISVAAGAWLYAEVVAADPAAFPTATKVGMGVGLTGTPAAGDTFYGDELSLRVYDATTGVPVADALVPPVTVDDWGANSGINYEYRWVANGANGAATNGPWTD